MVVLRSLRGVPGAAAPSFHVSLTLELVKKHRQERAGESNTNERNLVRVELPTIVRPSKGVRIDPERDISRCFERKARREGPSFLPPLIDNYHLKQIEGEEKEAKSQASEEEEENALRDVILLVSPRKAPDPVQA